MNPDLLAALTRSLGITAPRDATSTVGRQPRPEGWKEATDRLLGSPEADTLNALSGGGRARRAHLDPYLNGAIGQYHIPTGNISFTSPSNHHENQIDVLSHEMGHRRDFRSRRPGFGYLLSPPDRRFVVPKTSDDLQQKASDKVDPYYKTSPEEGYAQAFASAMGNARWYGKVLPGADTADPRTRDIIAGALAEDEAKTPGMGSLLAEVLGHPMYEKHPLRAFVHPVKPSPR